MDKRIIFIHKSEILAEGMNSFLYPTFGMSLVHLFTIEDMYKLVDIENCFTLFIIDEDYSKEVMKLDLSMNNNVDFLWLTKTDCEAEDKLYAFSSIEEVKTRVECILRKNDILTNRNSLVKDLSDREIDVLKLVAKGFANREIGEQLYISIHTVISHRKNITEKLGIKSISGLTVYAILNKLVEPQEIS